MSNDTQGYGVEASELRQDWPIVLACSIGIGVGIVALPYSTLGLFISPLENEFGWTRTAISIGPSLMLAIVALLSPISGWLADRYNAGLIIGVSLSSVSVCLLLISAMSGPIYIFYTILSLMATFGVGASTIIFARIVCSVFDKQRGLALGLVMAGNGITAILSPVLVGPIIADYGWRIGYQFLALIVFVSVPTIIFLLQSRKISTRNREAVDQHGWSLPAAIKTSYFWRMGIAYFFGTFAATGMVVHLIPHLLNEGLPYSRATQIASMIGFGLITGRLITGWLMDRYTPSYVGALMLLLSALGLLVLALGGEGLAFIGALAIGFCIGAELDIIGFLTARYFGMRSYGQIYGALYMLCAGGTAVSPIFYGIVFDRFGSYHPGIFIGSTTLILAGFLIFSLPKQGSLSPISPMTLRGAIE